MLHLRSRLLPLLRASSRPTAIAPSSSLHLRALLLSTSTSTSASPTPFSIEEYLVATCDLTGAQALKASKKLSHVKSASNPDAVLSILSGVGLSRPDIAAVVAADPLFLCSRVHNVAHRLANLRDRLGLSAPEIARFLLVGAVALRSCDLAPKLEFWIPFFGSFDKLLHIVKGNRSILMSDLEKVAKPNIALLEQCGLCVRDIAKMSQLSARLLGSNPERVKEFVLRADKLGVPRSSYTFKYAVGTVSCVTENKATARLEFLKSTLGCSMDKLSVAVCKHPQILKLSEENLRCKIEFLRSTLGCSKDKLGVAVCIRPQILGLSVEKLRHKIEFMVTEVGFEPEYIVERPLLLTYSVEKRLVPRHYVIKILQAKGLLKKGASLYTLVCYADKDFTAKYIDSHKDTVPGLADAYAAARAGKVPSKAQL